uniref:Secreted protein n=1 Tax=Macrostomum lignano TaxID=282301 RepID=A0A1I8FI54_9PLAT
QSVSRHVPYFSKKFRLASQSFLLSLLLAAAQLNAAEDNFGCLVRCMECFRFDECLRPDAPSLWLPLANLCRTWSICKPMEAWIGAIVTSDDLSETTLPSLLTSCLTAGHPCPTPCGRSAKHLRFVEELRRCPYMSRKQFCTRHADAIIDLIGGQAGCLEVLTRLQISEATSMTDVAVLWTSRCRQALVDTMRFVCSLVQPLKPSGSSRQSLPLSFADFTKPSLRNCILWQFSAQLNFSTDWQFLLSLLP